MIIMIIIIIMAFILLVEMETKSPLWMCNVPHIYFIIEYMCISNLLDIFIMYFAWNILA